MKDKEGPWPSSKLLDLLVPFASGIIAALIAAIKSIVLCLIIIIIALIVIAVTLFCFYHNMSTWYDKANSKLSNSIDYESISKKAAEDLLTDKAKSSLGSQVTENINSFPNDQSSSSQDQN